MSQEINYAVPQTTQIQNLRKYQKQHETEELANEGPIQHDLELPPQPDNTLPPSNFLANADSPKPDPHRYLYAGAAVIVLGFYALYIFLCKWRKDSKNKKPIKNQLIEEKMDESTTPGGSSKMTKQVELVELP